MVTAYQAEMAFAINNLRPTTLNLDGGVAGTVTLIGYGHGHTGHFVFTNASTGKNYAAAATDDGIIYVKPIQWAANIPNYALDVSKLSEDLNGTSLGNVATLFPSIASTIRDNKNLPFTAVNNGASANVGGYIGGATGGIKNSLTGGGSGTGGGGSTGGGETGSPKWVMPAVIAGVVLILGTVTYFFLKK